LFLVTHDHLDHLDPETLAAYRHKDTTRFVAPRFAGRKLAALGVPEDNLTRVDAGETVVLNGVTISGVFALPTAADALDTLGFHVVFPNGRSVYLAGDTAYCPLLLEAAPRGVDVLLVAINGKWGNLSVEQAVELTRVVRPRYVSPNHYDVMALNSERPETFRYFCAASGIAASVQILDCGGLFTWGENDGRVTR
jgi:L-ascorbate 6-phosphate lactonase